MGGTTPMNDTATPPALVVRASQVKPGFVYGLSSPTLAIQTNLPPAPDELYDALWGQLQAATAAWDGFEHLDPELAQQALDASHHADPLARWLLSACIWLQSLAMTPVTSHGLSTRTADGRMLTAIIPTQTPIAGALHDLLTALVAKTNEALAAPGVPPQFDDLRPLCDTMRARLRQFPPNTGYLLCAASRLDIPVSHHIGQYYLFGQGRHQVLLNSSMPGHESYFGCTVAKNKVMANAMLRQMGLPVPEQVAVPTMEDACTQASRIGYPVVVKPADLDGGNGVFPFLQDETALRAAWELCRTKTANIILEKHIIGLDYRLLVAKGELIAAIERSPAMVTGDGQGTVAELLEAENQRRKPAPGKAALLHPLPDDAETVAVLAAQGFGRSDVLPAGQVAQPGAHGIAQGAQVIELRGRAGCGQRGVRFGDQRRHQIAQGG